MEKMLGRRLTRGEIVRFKDGNKTNHDEDNLELCQNTKSVMSKVAILHSKISEAIAQLEDLIRELPENEREEARKLRLHLDAVYIESN